MTKLVSTARRRTTVAALLAAGLLSSVSACGGNGPSTMAVSDTQAIQGSPLVACGMAQLTPRVPGGDPLLARANTFYNQLDQTQQVPPAVQAVYNTDVDGLNPDQQQEVLLLLSSLNQCPGLSPQLQQSVLDVFDRLAPDPVETSGTSDDSAGPTVVVRSVRFTVQDSTDHQWWDGEWEGRPWWFRPVWDHPIIDLVDWAQWGAERRIGVIWFWRDSGWWRFGRPTDAAPDRPWLPVVIGTGTLRHEPRSTAVTPQNPPSGQLSPMGTPGTPAAQPDGAVTPQVQRPAFGNVPPDTTGSGTSSSSSTTAPSAAPTNSNSGGTSNTTVDFGSTPSSNPEPAGTPTSDTGSTSGSTTTDNGRSFATPSSG